MLKWSARAIPSAPSTSHTTCCYSRQILIKAVRTVTVTCTVDRHQATITAAPERLTVPQVGLKAVAADAVNVWATSSMRVEAEGVATAQLLADYLWVFVVPVIAAHAHAVHLHLARAVPRQRSRRGFWENMRQNSTNQTKSYMKTYKHPSSNSTMNLKPNHEPAFWNASLH